MEELKPCPFCGGEAMPMGAKSIIGSVYSGWVECKECGARSGETPPEFIDLPWNERAERTCTNVGYYVDSTRFKCSECGYNGWTKYANDGRDKVPRYCPNCGARVIAQ